MDLDALPIPRAGTAECEWLANLVVAASRIHRRKRSGGSCRRQYSVIFVRDRVTLPLESWDGSEKRVMGEIDA
jgi:hypothetical protein